MRPPTVGEAADGNGMTLPRPLVIALGVVVLDEVADDDAKMR
jgi:hypothetical protein